MKRFLLSALFVLPVAPAWGAASTAPVSPAGDMPDQPLTLASALARAVENNPALAARHFGERAAEALIEQAGLRVPQDIAVVGFDGTELSEMVSPPLSTIEQPSRDIGRKAVDLLLNKIDNPDAPTERVMMDWRYVARAST